MPIANLKEINKCLEFFNIFSKYLLSRKTVIDNNNELLFNEIIEFYKDKTEFDIYIYAINLSLYTCYYLKLVNNNSRKKLVEILNKDKYFNNGDFLKVPILEQNYLINNLQIEKGISKNQFLKENLFILFVCIINKKKLITIGNTGTSKSLAIKILQSSMKGPLSKSFLLKQYPELLILKIQGTTTTSSQNIIDIFERAKHCHKMNEDMLIAVFFKDMDKIEDNPDNPLKNIYSEFESENKITFIGTSNWFLDISLMNKVIYSINPEFDENDIIEIGEEIIKSYENKEEKYFEKYGNIIINLCKAYYKYNNKKRNEEIKKEKDNEKNIHSIKDLYSLIKSLMNDIINNKNKILEEKDIAKMCSKNIERNFGGMTNSIKDFKSFFFMNNKEFNNEYNILDCIKNNSCSFIITFFN